MLWTNVIQDLRGNEILYTFYQKKLQKSNQDIFRVDDVLKRKESKIQVKYKNSNDTYNTWIKKSDIVLNCSPTSKHILLRLYFIYDIFLVRIFIISDLYKFSSKNLMNQNLFHQLRSNSNVNVELELTNHGQKRSKGNHLL